MAIDTAVLDLDLGYVIADLPATFVIHGETITAMAGELTEAEQNDELAGLFTDRSRTVQAQVSSFDVAPAIGETCTIDGTSHRVTMLTTSADGVGYTLQCERLTA